MRLLMKKNSRMAAAVENMAQMGFEESLVISTVQELLKLYTEGGWFFIEDNSYLELLNALLKKKTSSPQEDEQEHHPLQQQEEGDCGIVAAELLVGSSNLPAIETQENPNPEAEETVGEAPSPPPPRQRKPYYGWISKDDGEDHDIIELPSMPLDVFEDKWSFLPVESDLDLDEP